MPNEPQDDAELILAPKPVLDPTPGGAPPVVSAKDIAARWEVAGAEIAKAMQNELVIAFVGAASAGKDAAIRALFGVDFGQVDPIPGSTDRLRAIRLDADGRVMVINAPGFGDLRPEVESTSRSLVERLDVAIYMVNADGGATADDRAALQSILALQRPVLVCVNKIDLIREHQREVLFRTTITQLGVGANMALACAFDPLPGLGEPIGVQEVIDWLSRTLTKEGKGLLFAKQLRDRAAASEPLIRAASRAAALAGAVPVPGADIAAVSAVQVKLISDIAAVHEVRVDRDVALFIMGEALAGASKGFVRWALNVLKAAGWIPGGQLGELAASALGATISAAATYGVGQAAVRYMARAAKGETMTGDEIREVFNEAAFAYKDAQDAPSPGAPE